MAHKPDLLKYPKTFGHQLPEFFSIAEFEYSEVALKHNIDNYLTNPIHYDNARLFLIEILDPIRIEWTKYCFDNDFSDGAIVITSGYRSKDLNDFINGSETSAHCLGLAADIKPRNKKMKEFQKWLVNYLKKNKVKFDQLIIESPKNGVASWLHIGRMNSKGQTRKQIFALDEKGKKIPNFKMA